MKLGDLIARYEVLNARGVRSVNVGGKSIDISTPQGRMLAALRGSFSQFEQELFRQDPALRYLKPAARYSDTGVEK